MSPSCPSYVKRLDLARDDDTSARVFYEIANCFFHVQHYTRARDAATLAVQHAAKSGNSLIQLQCTVLLAVCHVKDQHRDKALTTFRQALQHAAARDDQEAEAAIRDAMKSLKSKVQQAVDRFKEGLVRGRRMANTFYPMTDWVSHLLDTKLATGQGNKLLKGPGFIDTQPPRWRHF
ncbi:outer dynein arm-docking complex subunit 4-like [Babylonia areolata]|uniref:outer dynein arm-docking complex subunit 4-like n=1 Tax=Babylonia areolata TaxID=304850 RepID=UPI003FD56C22